MRGEGDKGKWDQMPKRRRHRALFKHEMNNKNQLNLDTSIAHNYRLDQALEYSKLSKTQ